MSARPDGGSQLKKRKICIIGYSRVGKSSLPCQFVDNNFPDSYNPTIANTFSKRFQINNTHYSIEVYILLGISQFYSLFSLLE